MKFKKKIMFLVMALAFMVSAFFMSQSVRASTIYKGVDVYEYDNISNYQKLKDAGTSVVIQKATQGRYHNDSLLQYRYNTLRQYGFKIGFYHFADNDGQATAQAQHFLSQIKGLHSDTCLWLDIENQPNWAKSTAIDFTNKFVSYVQSQGYSIGIYTGLSFYYEYLQGNINSSLPVWLASYGRQPQQYPNVVSWQYSESGSLNGVIGDIDLDYFNDSIFTGNKPNSTKNNTSSQSITPNSTIKQIQHNLNRLINAGLQEDGIQGIKTAQAIENFQSMMGLQQDGIAGSQTQYAMNQILSMPTDGVQYSHMEYSTRWAQWRVNTSIDGTFGNGTANAVKNFQRNNGLEVDGIVGQNTWKVLFR